LIPIGKVVGARLLVIAESLSGRSDRAVSGISACSRLLPRPQLFRMLMNVRLTPVIREVEGILYDPKVGKILYRLAA
jgi:hypothetical protein